MNTKKKSFTNEIKPVSNEEKVCLSNKILVCFLQDAFPDLQGMWPEFPNVKYAKGYMTTKMEKFLSLLGIPDYGSDTRLNCERTSFLPLSARQLWCSTAAFLHCHNNHVGSAIHEFMDCIDNYGEIYENERKISPDEHVLYYGLATTILLAIKNIIV